MIKVSGYMPRLFKRKGDLPCLRVQETFHYYCQPLIPEDEQKEQP